MVYSQLKPEGFNYSPGIVFGSELKEFSIPCFRCGECCTHFRVVIDRDEAHGIADSLGIEYAEFINQYMETKWRQAGHFLLRRDNGDCIFLNRHKDDKGAICEIQQVKPKACRLWTPSLYRAECLNGLTKCWGLKVSESGGISGPPDNLKRFYGQLKALAKSR